MNIIVETKRKRYKKIGLALGGGASRGIAILGVLKAFEEYNLKWDYIAGTSVGALVGGLYASGVSLDTLIEEVLNLKVKDIRSGVLPFVPSSTEGIQNLVKKFIPDDSFDNLKIPFCAVVTDVLSGKELHIESGSISKAIAGSCAVPVVFSPVEWGDDALLYDGGLQNNIPANVPKLKGCDGVVAVDINSTRGSGAKSRKYFDVVGASVGIMMKSNSIKGYLNADVMICPDLKRFDKTKFTGAKEMIEEGYKATIEKMPEILEIFKRKRFRTLFTFKRKKK